MEKIVKCGFPNLDEPKPEYLPIIEELKGIYKEMGQGDNLLEHSPSRIVEYPWTLEHIKGERILDAGCGASPMLLYLKRKGIQDVTGIDAQSSFDNPTFSFKPEWERQYGITYQQANIINYRSKVYDTVYCVSVIEHIFRPVDRAKAVLNLWENVRDGGRLIITLDYDYALLAGVFMLLGSVAKVVDSFSYKDKVFGICFEKVGVEGQAEWVQANSGL